MTGQHVYVRTLHQLSKMFNTYNAKLTKIICILIFIGTFLVIDIFKAINIFLSAFICVINFILIYPAFINIFITCALFHEPLIRGYSHCSQLARDDVMLIILGK